MPQLLRSASRWVTRLALFALLAALAAAISILTLLPQATGGAALTVLTGSMSPEIPVGSTVVVRPIDPIALQVGDVITFQRKPGKAEFVTHRITAIDTATTPISFTTKGDANRAADLDPVPATAIRGKVWFGVPYLGSARELLGNRSLAMLAAVLGLVGYAGYQLVSAWRDRRKSSTDPVSQPEPEARPLVGSSTGTTDAASRD